MRIKKLLQLFLAAVLALQLAGCSVLTAESSEGGAMLQVPAQPPEQRQLVGDVYEYLGETAVLKYPMDDASSNPFFLWDADGDGRDELLVVYQNTVKSKNVQLAVFGQDGGSWHALHMDVEGMAGEVHDIQLVRLENGKEYLLAAYQDGSGFGWTVCLYEWRSGALHLCDSLVCQQYLVDDFNGDGCQQIVTVQRNTTYGQQLVRMYGVSEPGKKSDDRLLQEQCYITLDPRLGNCLSIRCAADRSGEKQIVMDFTKSDDSQISEVIYYDGKAFARCHTQDGQDIPGLTDRDLLGIGPMDLDEDGVFEVPHLESLYQGEKTGMECAFLSWYSIEKHQARLTSCGIADTKAGFFLQLPLSWYGRIILQEDAEGVWSVRDLNAGTHRLSFFLTPERQKGGEFFMLKDLGNEFLYIRFDQSISKDSCIQIASGIRMLYP